MGMIKEHFRTITRKNGTTKKVRVKKTYTKRPPRKQYDEEGNRR